MEGPGFLAESLAGVFRFESSRRAVPGDRRGTLPDSPLNSIQNCGRLDQTFPLHTPVQMDHGDCRAWWSGSR